MLLPNRHEAASEYRYGFQGQEVINTGPKSGQGQETIPQGVNNINLSVSPAKAENLGIL
jgi:hypothetical protein